MDRVNHPSHYNIEGKKECIEQMRDDYGDIITATFCLTNAYKYLYRAGYKDNRNEDIEKAKWYLNYFYNMSVVLTDNMYVLLTDVTRMINNV